MTRAIVGAFLGALVANLGALLLPGGVLTPVGRAAWSWGGSTPTPRRRRAAPTPSCAAWGGWGSCSAACGGGTQSRTRTEVSSGCSGVLSESQSCNTAACASCGTWGSWASCSAACGGGTQARTRTEVSSGCSGVLSESQACNPSACASCGTWGEWASCDTACGGGTQARARTEVDGGCSGVVSQSQACNPSACASCGEWGQWASCDAACGGGTQARTRTEVSGGCNTKQDGDENTKTIQSQACNTGSCNNAVSVSNPVNDNTVAPTTTAGSPSTSTVTVAATTTAAPSKATATGEAVAVSTTESITGQAVVTADGVFADEVKTVFQETLASNLGVDKSKIDVVVTKQVRRLQMEHGLDRRLASSFAISYTVTIPKEQATALATKVQEMSSDSKDFNDELKKGLIVVVKAAGQSEEVINASFEVSDFSIAVTKVESKKVVAKTTTQQMPAAKTGPNATTTGKAKADSTELNTEVSNGRRVSGSPLLGGAGAIFVIVVAYLSFH